MSEQQSKQEIVDEIKLRIEALLQVEELSESEKSSILRRIIRMIEIGEV